jgi:cytochrome c556
MKTVNGLIFSGLVAAVIAVGLSWSVGQAQSKRNRAAKEFMREKLDLSQKVLEGLAVENFDLIITKGSRLSAMSQEADWRVFENPDYDQQSRLFRREVEALVRAAKRKDLDGATLAYLRVTLGCVDCHKLVRGKLVAEGQRPSAQGPLAL